MADMDVEIQDPSLEASPNKQASRKSSLFSLGSKSAKKSALDQDQEQQPSGAEAVSTEEVAVEPAPESVLAAISRRASRASSRVSRRSSAAEPEPVPVAFETIESPVRRSRSLSPSKSSSSLRRKSELVPVEDAEGGVLEEKADEPAKAVEPVEEVAMEEEIVKEPTPAPEPTPPPEPTAEEIQRALDAKTSFIESAESTMNFASHAQLERPGLKSSQRRRPTNNVPKSFAGMEAEESKRMAEDKKPKLEVNQAWDDPLDLLGEYKKGQRNASLAFEAQNIHAAFAQKAKERKLKEEAAIATAAITASASSSSATATATATTPEKEPAMEAAPSALPRKHPSPPAALACCVIC